MRKFKNLITVKKIDFNINYESNFEMKINFNYLSRNLGVIHNIVFYK